MHQITEWILMKFVIDSVCIHFPLSSTAKKKSSYWNCFHTVVRGSEGTYIVPHCRICYSLPLNSSVHASQPVTSLWQQTVKKHSITFYLLSTVRCTQCKEWATQSAVYCCQNYLEIKFLSIINTLVFWLAMGWTVWGSNPSAGGMLHTHTDLP
jgi:hypothetical protein